MKLPRETPVMTLPNATLFPQALLPLYIFEPRYRQMVKRCLDEKSEFGILLSLPKGLARVGCTAEILEVVQRYDDGRMDILTVGRAVFRAVELFTEEDLLEGRVDYLEDRESTAHLDKQDELVELYETCHTLIFETYPKNLGGELPEKLSHQIAGTLPMDLLWKQQILESRTEADRQERLIAYLRGWAPHLQNKKTLSQGAGGNGHGLN